MNEITLKNPKTADVVDEVLKKTGIFSVLSEKEMTCPKHGIQYTQKVYKYFVRGCPECKKERDLELARQDQERRKALEMKWLEAHIENQLGRSRIPKRFQDKTFRNYFVDENNSQQVIAFEAVKGLAKDFSKKNHPRHSFAFIGESGTGKTHLACALINHIVLNCGGLARFSSVFEIDETIRHAKSFDSQVSVSEVIQAFGKYDLLVIDEVGVQSRTEAEARALFDVFNERYQNEKPTILISNLDIQAFEKVVGNRIIDRLKEDNGGVLLFNWESYRGKNKNIQAA